MLNLPLTIRTISEVKMQPNTPGEVFCASSLEAAAMSDSEFWDAVYNRIDECYAPDYDYLDSEVPLIGNPCPLCHAVGACGYDSEGRALIHALTDESV